MTYHEPFDKLSKDTIDLHRALRSIAEELDAIDWYQQRIDATKDDELKAILAHNRDEEKEHAVMLLEWVRRKDKAFAKEIAEYISTKGDIVKTESES